MTPSPKVSIGLPVYNGEAYLRVAVDSILAQDYGDFELIISDNASTDSTAAICSEYAARDARVRYYRAPVNHGASRNFTFVFEQARGEYFRWASHDDVLKPEFLRRCVEVLDQAPASVVLVGPQVEVIGADGRPLGGNITAEVLEARRPRPHQRCAEVLRTVQWGSPQYGLYRTRALRRTSLIGPYFGSDYTLLLELALQGEIWQFPEVLFQKRFHPGVSILANKTDAELAAWFSPSAAARHRFVSPMMYCGVEYVRAIARSDLPLGERAVCSSTATLVWYSRQLSRVASGYQARLASAAHFLKRSTKRAKAFLRQQPVGRETH
jgi:glycosyltransferase involved in cell wall biosynthesis